MPPEFVDAMARSAGMLVESITYAVLSAPPILICAWLLLRGVSYRRELRGLPVQQYRFLAASSAFVACGVLAHVIVPSVYKRAVAFVEVLSLLAMLPLAVYVAYLGARVVRRRKKNPNSVVEVSSPDVAR